MEAEPANAPGESRMGNQILLAVSASPLNGLPPQSASSFSKLQIISLGCSEAEKQQTGPPGAADKTVSDANYNPDGEFEEPPIVSLDFRKSPSTLMD